MTEDDRPGDGNPDYRKLPPSVRLEDTIEVGEDGGRLITRTAYDERLLI